MATLTQALLLGTERLTTPPVAPHPALEEAWAQLDWSGQKDAALLEATALLGSARSAGAVTNPPLPAPDVAPPETLPHASPRAVAVLRRLFAEEWRALLPEWLELCAARGAVVPPFFLRTLFQLITEEGERAVLRKVAGGRGGWLAQQNPEWSWLNAGAGELAGVLHIEAWETGSVDDRLAWLRHVRTHTPTRAREMIEKTWSDEAPDFRARVLELIRPTLSLADEPFLTRVLKDRRKDVRLAAQALLVSLPESGLATRMRARAEALLAFQRSLLTTKFEVTLPAAFDPAWAADGLDEKPPAGVGEKAFWTQQVLGLVPVRHWTEKFGLETERLLELAGKSSDWGDLLLGAWYRAACLHRESAVAAALLRPLLAHPKALPPGVQAHTAASALLAVCEPSQRWRIVAAEPEIAWAGLPLLTGTPAIADARAVLEHLSRAIRDGYNPGGSPGAVLAARRLPPSLRDDAARLLTRDNGLSKPADAFLQALELRAAMHDAFSNP